MSQRAVIGVKKIRRTARVTGHELQGYRNIVASDPTNVRANAELRAAALLEAGKAYIELNQRDQANRQFERILREFPGTPWADAAKEKLGQK